MALFEAIPVEQVMPLVVVRMTGKPYENRYMVLDGHHRTATAKRLGIDLLLVHIWRDRGGIDLIVSPQQDE